MRELRYDEVKYSIDFSDMYFNDKDYIPEYKDVYEKISMSLQIDKEGYNVYLIDDFSKNKLDNLIDFIKDNLKKEKPKDICYVVMENPKTPQPIFLPGGKGRVFKEFVDKIQEEYLYNIDNFYNSSDDENKEELLDNIKDSKNKMLNNLITLAEDNGFQMKVTHGGITFMPVKKDGESMTEKEYDELDEKDRENIVKQVSLLKKQAEDILEKIKEDEILVLDKLRKIMKVFLKDSLKKVKTDYKEEFKGQEAEKFLDFMCENIEKELIHNYTMDLEEDEEEIIKIAYKYKVNIIVDNSENEAPLCIYEEDPTLENLLGSIEYENKAGTYATDINLIKAGSMLKANGGCLIVRLNNLLTNPSSYYYLKKSLLLGKVDLDYNKRYLELLSLDGMHPMPVNIKEKVILIGDFESYRILYNNDEDFRKIFKIKAEYDPVVNVNPKSKSSLIKSIDNICSKNNLKPVNQQGIYEISKYLSRKIESKEKLYFNMDDLENILILSNNHANKEGKDLIKADDVEAIAYKKDIIEDEIMRCFKEGKVYINLSKKEVGQVNGLTVLDTGYYSFGKPVRITCNCFKGDGNIIDVQKENSLSGRIHSKSINILSGYINKLLGGYTSLPVDFNLSFEQTYGKVDGDSASVAEIIAIFSSLSKIGVKGNIAVTGSINQLGEVQPIGGVNEKIEGFFGVCKKIDNIKDKGVLIPEANKDSLVLSKEIEEEIKNGNFHIYVMKNVEDAVNVLMGDETLKYKDVLSLMEKEIKKYISKRKG